MKDYLLHTVNHEDFNMVSITDELPLWAAPFGLKLLDVVKLKKEINALDIGCGLGFPLVELAQRLGKSCKVYGIDPWQRAIERVNLKIKTYNLQNVKAIKGVAEELPFENDFFDLLVSNNGLNNVKDLNISLSECSRVCKSGAQFVISLNLEESMIEFYGIFEKVLRKNGLNSEVEKMKKHIYEKRRPLEEIKKKITNSGFTIRNIYQDKFNLKFLDADAMFNHSLIKYWFLGSWKNIVQDKNIGKIFEQIEVELNILASKTGELILTIPFIVIDSIKN